MIPVAPSTLAQHGRDRLAERSLIGGLQNTEPLEDEILFKGRENRFDRRWLQQIRRLPLAYLDFTQAGGRMHLAGDRHDNETVLATLNICASCARWSRAGMEKSHTVLSRRG